MLSDDTSSGDSSSTSSHSTAVTTTPTSVTALYARLVVSDMRQDDMITSILAHKQRQEAHLQAVLENEKQRTVDLVTLRLLRNEEAASLKSRLRELIIAGGTNDGGSSGVPPETERTPNKTAESSPNTAGQQDHSPPAPKVSGTPPVACAGDSSSLSGRCPTTNASPPNVHNTEVQADPKPSPHATALPSSVHTSASRPHPLSNSQYCGPWNFGVGNCEESHCKFGKRHACFHCHRMNTPSEHRVIDCRCMGAHSGSVLAGFIKAAAIKFGPTAAEDGLPEHHAAAAPTAAPTATAEALELPTDSEIVKTTEDVTVPVRTPTPAGEDARVETSTAPNSSPILNNVTKEESEQASEEMKDEPKDWSDDKPTDEPEASVEERETPHDDQSAALSESAHQNASEEEVEETESEAEDDFAESATEGHCPKPHTVSRHLAPLPKMGTDDVSTTPVHQYCYAWNTADGNCKAPTCPDGSLHNCYICHPKNEPADHPAKNCPAFTADRTRSVPRPPVACEVWNNHPFVCEAQNCVRGHLHICSLCLAHGKRGFHRARDCRVFRHQGASSP